MTAWALRRISPVAAYMLDQEIAAMYVNLQDENRKAQAAKREIIALKQPVLSHQMIEIYGKKTKNFIYNYLLTFKHVVKMKTFHFLPLAVLCTSIFIASCSDDEETQEMDCMNYMWAYEGDSNPATWASCNPDCGGQSQSPINIAMTMPGTSLSALQTNYEEVPIDLMNNGHTVEFAYAAGSTLTLNGVEFVLEQFHFHTESEHTLNGNHFPMETHLVHKNSAGDLAVIAILYEDGAENAFLSNFFDNLPETAGDDFTSPDLVNIEALFPASQAYFTYGGSLTTPPCSEAVSWFIMQNPVEASTAQINSMNDILKENNRPIQATNGRPIMAFN